MNTLEQIRAMLQAYPMEVAFPDIRRWQRGTAGVDYVHAFDSGVPGPHVMIMALTHGNEVSGAIAVDQLLRARLKVASHSVLRMSRLIIASIATIRTRRVSSMKT